jgi:hypothetical protein
MSAVWALCSYDATRGSFVNSYRTYVLPLRMPIALQQRTLAGSLASVWGRRTPPLYNVVVQLLHAVCNKDFGHLLLLATVRQLA